MANDSFWDNIKEGVQVVASVGFTTLWGSVKKSINELFDEAQNRLDLAVNKLIKAFSLLSAMIFAFILIIVGFGKYLSETVPALNHGLGYVLLGIIIMVLALIFSSYGKKK